MRKKIWAWMMAAVMTVTPAASVAAQDIIIEYEEYAEYAVPEAGDVLSEIDSLIIEEIQVDETAGPETELAETEPETELNTEPGIEVIIEDAKEAEAPSELTELAMEAEIPDSLIAGQLTETGSAAAADMPLFRTFSRSVYVDSYGAQLTGLAAALYEEMESAYAVEKGSGQISHTLESPYTFSVPDLQIVEVDGKKSAVWDSAANEEYQAVAAEIRYGMQAAYDAFIYDHPEVFWMAAPGYVWSIRFTGTAESGYTGKISKILIRPNECYAGASAETAAFDLAVDEVVSELSADLSQEADARDIVAAIHDCLCNMVSYGENAHAHTAAGVFLKDRIVVCEGYAKAFRILCQEFGVASVLIPGGALKSNGSTEAHMWNYVKMDDGKWYLVDVTWDDQNSHISRTYFLAGSTSAGFVDVIGTERSVYSKFSGSATETQVFAMPVLSLEAYGMHSWEEELTVDREATCARKGTASIHCSVCDEVKEGSKVTLPRLAVHKWESEATVDQKPTCTAKGLKSIHCSVCEKVQEGSEQQISKLAHTYGKYKVTKEATVLQQGAKTRTCSACGKKQTKAIAKLERTMTVNVTSLKLQVGQKTTQVKVSGLGKGDSVASWKSSNTKVATVSKSGKITAKKAGKAVITITLKSKLSKKITVTVQKAKIKTAKISGLKSSVTIKKGKTLTLKPVLEPITSQEKITYTSKNSKIAAVDKNGKITAKKKGTTYVTVKSGTISKKVKIIVK